MPLKISGTLVGVYPMQKTEATEGRRAEEAYLLLDVVAGPKELRSVKLPLTHSALYEGREGDKIELPVRDYPWSVGDKVGVAYKLNPAFPALLDGQAVAVGVSA
jgi:hypothetical protein